MQSFSFSFFLSTAGWPGPCNNSIHRDTAVLCGLQQCWMRMTVGLASAVGSTGASACLNTCQSRLPSCKSCDFRSSLVGLLCDTEPARSPSCWPCCPLVRVGLPCLGLAWSGFRAKVGGLVILLWIQVVGLQRCILTVFSGDGREGTWKTSPA